MRVHGGAEIVAQSAKGRVPVAKGELRDAIHVEREGVARTRSSPATRRCSTGTWSSTARPATASAVPGARAEDGRERDCGLVAAALRGL